MTRGICGCEECGIAMGGHWPTCSLRKENMGPISSACNTAPLIQMGKRYKDKAGEVRIICVDADVDQPVIGLINGSVFRYSATGHCWNGRDLIEIKPTVKRIVFTPDVKGIYINGPWGTFELPASIKDYPPYGRYTRHEEEVEA